VPGCVAHRLVVDVRVCDGIGFAKDCLGERRSVVHSLLVLFITVSHRIDVAVLCASIFAASGVGAESRSADRSDQEELRDCVGGWYHRVNDSYVE
jgi:hypothetical protein